MEHLLKGGIIWFELYFSRGLIQPRYSKYHSNMKNLVAKIARGFAEIARGFGEI
jgi:hypothetical protein